MNFDELSRKQLVELLTLLVKDYGETAESTVNKYEAESKCLQQVLFIVTEVHGLQAKQVRHVRKTESARVFNGKSLTLVFNRFIPKNKQSRVLNNLNGLSYCIDNGIAFHFEGTATSQKLLATKNTGK